MRLARKGCSVELLALTKYDCPNGSKAKFLMTVVAEYPKVLDAQVNMHKMFSKSAASSRAVPTPKVLGDKVPFWTPEVVGFNCKGMAPKDFMDDEQLAWFQGQWIDLRNTVANRITIINSACKEKFGKRIEKGIINRPLDSFIMIRKVLTATVCDMGWKNLWKLRSHGDAQSDFQTISDLSKELYEAALSKERYGEHIHLPFTTKEEREDDLKLAIMKSVANCAAVSYRNDITDLQTCNKIVKKLIGSTPEHWGPFEHQGFSKAVCVDWESHYQGYQGSSCFTSIDTDLQANFSNSGFYQLRKLWALERFNLTDFVLGLMWAQRGKNV